ncbi:hypothetical protein DdX_14309 [Ditylenchus destructor]|uniref:SXP/RAL-2 family protein Ani s 5-like cation-binding domain-containing protein n=1 Tax=Ditylenchus destructor TaxID=166010 RepID=A0AAD4QYP7_9BILA|nr:hypothetical protein DdX_14309 [Ditylenchus destructor]
MSLFPYRSSSTGNRPRVWSTEFMRHLDLRNQSLYFGTKLNTTFTKGEIADAIKIWLQTLPEKVQTNYVEWQANVTQIRVQFVESVKVNLSGPANQLYDKIMSIVDDKNLTRIEAMRRIMEFILNSRMKPWLELNRALGKALCHRLDMATREEEEVPDEELSMDEKNLNSYITAFDAEPGGVPLLDETLIQSLFVLRSALGLNPME